MITPKKASREFWDSVTSLGLPSFIILALVLFWGMNQSFSFVVSMVLYFFLEATGAGIKLIYQKDRPQPETRNTLFERYQSGSFPSLHTARISYLTMIVVFSGLFSQTVSVMMLLVLVLVAYSRIHLKKHFPLDIVGGLIVGALFGYIFLLLQ